MRRFSIKKYPYNNYSQVFLKSHITLKPGLTVLVGCNGSGKSTLLQIIRDDVAERGIPYLYYDNISGSERRMEFTDKFGMVGTVPSSVVDAYRESVELNLGQLAGELGVFVHEKHRDDKEIWILIDASDSGFSIDSISMLKSGLFDSILAHKPEAQDVYLVVSANQFEMCRGERCFLVQEGKYATFRNYEKYRKYILQSRETRSAFEIEAKQGRIKAYEKEQARIERKNTPSPWSRLIGMKDQIMSGFSDGSMSASASETEEEETVQNAADADSVIERVSPEDAEVIAPENQG